MPFLRASRVKLVWGLELALGLELYACAVLALHSRGLRATPLLASPGLVIPALVIPPVFYVLVGLVSVRPLSPPRLLAAVGAMCGVHAVLVVATGALFVIPDLVDYGAAVAFSLWGSPAVTMLQLTAAPLVLARLRPLLAAPRSTSRPAARATPAPRPPEASGAVTPSSPSREPAATSPAKPAQREPAAAAPAVAASAAVNRPPAVMSPTAPRPPGEPMASPPVTPAAREPMVTPAAVPAPRASAVTRPSPQASSGPAVPKPAAIPAEPMVRVSFSRIAEQLPVEMFARGRKGLNDTLRPGVSLLVPRSLLLPHLADGVAPVKWTVVADQFPRDELKLTHQEIESRLPDGSLLLPLDEVVPQIPPELLALSTPAVDVLGIEKFPPPFQPHLPSSETVADDVDAEVPEPDAEEAAVLAAAAPEASASEVEVSPADVEEDEEPAAEVPEIHVLELEALRIEVPEAEVQEAEVQELAVQELAASVIAGSRLAEVRLEEPAPPEAPEPLPPKQLADAAADRGRTAEARRIAALLAPLMNGLEIGERAGAGAPLVTVVAPTLSEDDVVATAVRVAPLLTAGRLSEPVTQATLTAPEATIVLTPIGSADGGALLVTAVASRASLAWLERLSRSAAGERGGDAPNGARASGESQADGLRATVVPPSVRELAGSLTAFGPVTPTVLGDTNGRFRVCLFLPGSIDAQPLAQLARDLYAALDGAEVGPVASVILRLGTYRLVMRAVAASSGQTTILVGGGPIDRPGLARIELDRAAAQLAALGRG